MAYYDTCPYCGANLDPGEKCDCQQKEASPAEGEFVSLSEREIKKGLQVREHHASQSAYNTILFYQTRTEMSRGSSYG